MIRTIEVDGIIRSSQMQSYLYSRNELIRARKEGYKDELGICRYCHGNWHREVSEGTIECVCWLMDKEKILEQRQIHASTSQRKTWDSFEVWGDPASRDALRNAIEVVDEWTKNMDSWLVIAGGYGVGKTHIMYILNTMFFPWSMYISAPDFEQIVFTHTGEGDLDRVIEEISKQPILLLDDVGAEHGSNYPKNMLRKVIDFRYRLAQEYPLVVTTNLGPAQLTNYDERTADRLMERRNTFIDLSKVQSRRRYV